MHPSTKSIPTHNDIDSFWADRKIIRIRMKPSGRYHLYKQLWGLRLEDPSVLEGGNEDEKSVWMTEKERLFEERMELLTASKSDSTSSSRNNSNTSNSSQHPSDKPERQSLEKHIRDSYCELLLPFADDAEIRSDYVSIYGGIRFGKILEDLDVLAATVAYLHCGTTTTTTKAREKLTIVTAAVDRIKVICPAAFDKVHNVRLRALATNVGRSSMEVSISLETQGKNRWTKAAIARFIMVARSADGSNAVPINHLVAETERDTRTLQGGEQRRQARLQRDQRSVFKAPPTEQESLLIHNMFLEQPPGIPISATLCKLTQLCQPQVWHPIDPHFRRETFTTLSLVDF